ncbi:hypothetical protein CDD80_6295 [Ophiocordyceps camponoti-rufipedis]|uniref:Xylanolytic transcriptional activator regulatory domain-containing protein n=1 Tax=Ophiocordyceps camponoti-rufipedis TaxID=2004952 RepID=A0A2C5ZH39_9HYPO|nr:hypothetical protein CDD80_6295 [Ophiocordyceps camponoti-rufipedis]
MVQPRPQTEPTSATSYEHLAGGGGAESSSFTPVTASGIPTVSSTADHDVSSDESALDADDGLTAQTTFASEFVEKAFGRGPLPRTNPNMEAALGNLRQLVQLQKRRSAGSGPRFPLQRSVPAGGLCKLAMPPMPAVVALLKQTKNAPPTIFSIVSSLVGIDDFVGLCRLVYFATDDFSDATFTIVNGMLYNLFLEHHALATDPVIRDEYHAYMQQCRVNLETCLANTPLFLSAKAETIQALLLGIVYAIDVSLPSVAWNLTCTAAQLCQQAGYHRAETRKLDSPATSKLKHVLFWHIYSLDKSLSLRLGRAPVINDCDIDISLIPGFDTQDPLATDGILAMWVKFGRLQSRIYEQLYSPAALARPRAELTERAEALAQDCRSLEAESEERHEPLSSYIQNTNSSELVDIFMRGDEVQFQVTCTLVYQVIPAAPGSQSRFCDECLEAARKAIRTHMKCTLKDLGSYFRSIYIHWNLLLTPFAPFFVLFCYVIETSSTEDLHLLRELVASLSEPRANSESVDKLYRLMQVMVDIAGLYVEAKTQQLQDQTMVSIGDEFDMYLSQLGFMPTEDHTMSNNTPGDDRGQTTQIADWFSGNRNMMGLLEEDLSQIDAYKWMQ